MKKTEACSRVVPRSRHFPDGAARQMTTSSFLVCPSSIHIQAAMLAPETHPAVSASMRRTDPYRSPDSVERMPTPSLHPVQVHLTLGEGVGDEGRCQVS